MHGRRVDIAEYEHRWMHERGACDCEVKFPGLQQPRLIKRSSIVEERATASTTKAGHFAISERNVPPTTRYNAGNPQITRSNIPRQSEWSAVPMYTEARVGDNVEVAVRLTSLYGAEWTKDHAKLHDSGKCKCPVSFERYKPLNINDDTDEDESPGIGYSDSPDQVQKTSYDVSSPTYSYKLKAPMTAIPSYASDVRTPSIDKNLGADPHFPHGYDQIAAGDIARWAVDGPQGSLLDHILGPIGPDTSKYGGCPVDIQTMHYPKTGIPISGNPIACETSQESGLRSIVEYQQPEKTLAGFPIGAGPEGESHAGDFDACSPQSGSGGSPGRVLDELRDPAIERRFLVLEYRLTHVYHHRVPESHKHREY
ncbi:hypothetical protein F5Y09DRAFT_356214 [Xylaria sp. FL1042]|nr:hypothetical protein F5Y09DRAFT_356214 [Xylaria sp. FL1042]